MILAALVVSGMALFLLKSRANYLRLPELPATVGPVEQVTVVIPARNEEANIGRAVQSFGGAPVIVVDDGSTDGTARVARGAGATVIPAPPLRPGCLGKPNACLAGASQARTDWVLFVDADTWYESAFLPSLLSYAHEHELDVATVFLRQTCVTWAERLLLPYAFALYFCGVSSRSVNAHGRGEALANGQCLLFRRSAYQTIGGHAAVMGSVIEDVALAAVVKRNGLRLRVLRAELLGSVRMYDGLFAIWRGLTKNSFRFLLVNPWSGAQVIAASILLTSYLPVVAVLAWRHAYAELAVVAIAPVVVLLPWYGGIEALQAPAAIYLFQAIALSGMVSTVFGIKSEWKGRRV